MPKPPKSPHRGADWNPQNRFDKIILEPDPDVEPSGPPIISEYFKDTTRNIISYNDSPDIGFSASLNPYRGCEHGCVYCYARPTHEYFGFSAGLDFESKIFVKEDAAKLLRKELARPKWEPQTVVMSGVTDPYQPVERRLGITRACLQVLADFRNPVAIITKNHLVARDKDIYREMAQWQGCMVNLSVTSLRRDIARVMEPRASIPENRLKAIEELTKAGVPVNVMVAPIVPGLTDEEVPSILKTVAAAGAISAHFVILRLPWAVKDLFVHWLEQNFPDRKDKVLNRLRELRGGKLYNAEWGTRMRGEGKRVEMIEQLFELSARREGLNRKRISLSTAQFRSVPQTNQLILPF